MQIKVLRPYVLIAAFILIVGLACAVGGSSTATEAPVSQSQDTQSAPAASDTPEAAQAQDFFTEEFNAALSDQLWATTITGDNQDKATYGAADGAFKFDLEGAGTNVYEEYVGHDYDDVRIEVTTENRGKNTLDVILICRASDEGWYEVRVGSDGLYWINAIDVIGAIKKGGNLIFNGGSKHIKTGRDANTYAFTCKGNTLAFEVNGVEERNLKENKFKFTSGHVGFGLSSYRALPIIINYKHFVISEP